MVEIQYASSVSRSQVRVADQWSLAEPTDAPSSFRPHLTFSKLALGRTSKEAKLQTDIATIPHAELSKGGAVYKLGGEMIKPEEVSGFILGKILLGLIRTHSAPPKTCIITVPAYFNWSQRQATLDAAYIADFNIDNIRLVEEPIAAVVDYVESDAAGTSHGTTVVVDVGGGTTDATAVTFETTGQRRVYVILATAGNNCLGGRDFDEALRKLVLKESSGGADSFDSDKLLVECEAKKRHLSTAGKVSIDLYPTNAGEQPRTVTVRRREFEDAAKPTIEAIADIISDLKTQYKAAENAETLLLVGGSCFMPCIEELCKKHFPGATTVRRKPDEAVARGASQAASNPNIVL